jgi:hypothetical protein
MKLKFLYLFIASLAVYFSACTPDEFDLGAKDVTADDLVEGLAFTITHDTNNPNIVYLESKMGSSYTALWEHPQGRSQASKVTLKMPFDGVYTVKFGVMTRGGVVYGEPVTFTINDFYAGFVDNELWTLISGGVGKSKTWYLDLDAEGVSRYFAGPLYFYGTADGWETVTNGATAPEGSDSWNWCPDYAGNTWLLTAADFGTMTFDLIGGANVIVEHTAISARGTEKGTYMLDVDNHIMRMTDASPLHDSNRDGVVVDWGNIKILSLTENAMQLGVLRDAVLSGESACLLVYNYISKDYKNNWTPEEKNEPEPTLPTNWQTDISQTVTTSVKWVLSPETPFNWANLDGSLMNTAWVSPETYDSWSGFDASIPATYANFSLTMDSKDNSLVYVDKDGNEQIGSYTLDEKGFYTFTGATPSFTICGGISLNTSANNQWRITSIEKNLSGKITGMWVGVRDAVKPEYMVYLLIPHAGSSSDGSEVDNGTETSFDASNFIINIKNKRS